MIRFAVLASSSKGNATLVSDGETHLLMDAGISAKRLMQGMSERGIALEALAAVVITHEHSDHCCGLGQICKKRPGMPIYCSRYLAREFENSADNASFHYLEAGNRCRIGSLELQCFRINHDAIDPLGYCICAGGSKLGYLTDTGKVSNEMSRIFTDVDALYLESNYDPEMLQNSGRSMALISRISGNFGHLSNQQASDFVRQIAHPGLQHIMLAHLSQDCNSPELAYDNMLRTLQELDLRSCELHCASPSHPMPWIEFERKEPFCLQA